MFNKIRSAQREVATWTAEEIESAKAELLRLAESGAPKPKTGTRLWKALMAFTVEPVSAENN